VADAFHQPLLKRTPFHDRTAALCMPQNWRRWAGYIAVGSYELASTGVLAIRNHAALIDVSPLMKYVIEGPDAARLLDKVTPRNIARLAVGRSITRAGATTTARCSTTARSRVSASRASG